MKIEGEAGKMYKFAESIIALRKKSEDEKCKLLAEKWLEKLNEKLGDSPDWIYVLNQVPYVLNWPHADFLLGNSEAIDIQMANGALDIVKDLLDTRWKVSMHYGDMGYNLNGGEAYESELGKMLTRFSALPKDERDKLIHEMNLKGNESEMAKLNEMFPSKYLKVDDLNGEKHEVTIAGFEFVEFEDFDGGQIETKPAIWFEEFDGKMLILNKTNANDIAELLDSGDTDDWIGKSIVLKREMVRFRAKKVPAIRVEAAEVGADELAAALDAV